jgi:uncharacterized protein (TIGR03067 family)
MSDLQNLNGAWRVVSMEMNGAAMPAAMLANAKIVIDGSRFTSLGMGAVYEGELSIDETSSPKTFALKFSGGPELGVTNRAIYTLDGDNWRFCLNILGGPAPKDFITTMGDGNALETLVRIAG